MNILVFDFETTGLPSWQLPSEDPIQPHIVELGALLVDEHTGNVINKANVIVRPDGWVIPDEVAAIHGITTERAMDEGIPEIYALDLLLELYRECRLRVAHNTTFDNRIARIALKRYRPDLISDEEWKDASRYYCTMMNFRKRYGGKQPTLTEAYLKATGEELVGAHSAMADTLACKAVYFHLNPLQQAA